VTSRFLDAGAPTATATKCSDSGALNFAKGNPFATVAVWNLAT
jgi:hypothetical protein